MPEELPPPAPPAGSPALTRTERRAKATSDALRTLVRDTYADRFGAARVPEEVPLTLRLTAKPGRQWELVFDPPLADQIADQMENAQAQRAVYRKGAVFCYRCETSDCEHASPASSLSVFAGYDSAGRPVWHELVQALVEARDPRVDRLYGRPPAVVAAVQLGSQIRGEQLAAFGRSSKTYAVLGQVIAGYLPCPPAPSSPQDAPARVALTFQVVETRGERGDFRLHLNPVAALPDGGEVDLLLGTGWEPSVCRARELAGREVDALEFRVRAARETGRAEEGRELLRQVPGILRRLADCLERGGRQGQRRTHHAERRREDQRPVPKAMEDAREARPDALFYDLKTHTFIVTGPRGRTHAFNAQGRHVTSFQIRPGAVEFRLRTERWRSATADEVAAIRGAWTAEDRGGGASS